MVRARALAHARGQGGRRDRRRRLRSLARAGAPALGPRCHGSRRERPRPPRRSHVGHAILPRQPVSTPRPLQLSRRVPPGDPRDAGGAAVAVGAGHADATQARVPRGDAGAAGGPTPPGAARARRGAPPPRDESAEPRPGPVQLPLAVPIVRPAVLPPCLCRRLRSTETVAGERSWGGGGGPAPPPPSFFSPRPASPPLPPQRRAPRAPRERVS